MLISCENLSKSFGATKTLQDINFLLNEKDKCAIIGVNGAGKTTLFKLITGEEEYDSGNLIIPNNVTIGYSKQELDLNPKNTIYDEMMTVFKEVIDLEKEIRITEIKMKIIGETELPKYLEMYDELSHKFESLNGYECKSRVNGIIKGLGFLDKDFKRSIKSLSGGQKTKISLGKMLLKEPDLLLLDEPTNHLDIASIIWLENYLKNYKKGLILISHDRYFLNNIVDKIIEIENTKAKTYHGNYEDFIKKKKEHISQELKNYKNQQKEIKKQEETIKKLKSYNREKSIKRAESREKMLQKMEIIDKPDEEPDTMRLVFTPKQESGKNVIIAKELTKYFKKILFKNINFYIQKGDKVAIIGENGIGKTTLLKIITGEDKTYTGEFKLGANVNIAFYDQEHQNLNMENTIFDEVASANPTLSNFEIRNALAAFMFMADDVDKKISDLSGGEKGRVAFSKIMLSEANFLILDEPTNHLDIKSKEVLENAIREYKGTVLYISHDRYFINNTANKIFYMDNKCINVYEGDYDYFMDKSTARETIQNKSKTKEELKEAKEEWLRQKREEAILRNKENRILFLERKINDLEKKLRKLNEEQNSEDISFDVEKLQAIQKEIERWETKLDAFYEEWDELTAEA